MDKFKNEHLVFTPMNEPYMGRASVLSFDEMICSCMEANTRIAPMTHTIKKTDLQEAACQLIPQEISLALSIRELVRQGYLYGASVLLRSLIERIAIIRYLQTKPDGIAKWKNGWQGKRKGVSAELAAPDLSTMLDAMASENSSKAGRDITSLLNSIVHGKPESILWNLVQMEEGQVGHAPSKILNDPKLCDHICFIASPMLVILLCSMTELFPEQKGI